MPATPTSDRICRPISLCAKSEYISVAATSTSDVECATATLCDLVTQFIEVRPDVSSDRICTDLSECNSHFDAEAPEFELEAPSLRQNRVCQRVGQCSNFGFEAQKPTRSADRACQSYSACNVETEYITRDTTKTSDVVCTKLGEAPLRTELALVLTFTTDISPNNTFLNQGETARVQNELVLSVKSYVSRKTLISLAELNTIRLYVDGVLWESLSDTQHAGRTRTDEHVELSVEIVMPDSTSSHIEAVADAQAALDKEIFARSSNKPIFYTSAGTATLSGTGSVEIVIAAMNSSETTPTESGNSSNSSSNGGTNPAGSFPSGSTQTGTESVGRSRMSTGDAVGVALGVLFLGGICWITLVVLKCCSKDDGRIGHSSIKTDRNGAVCATNVIRTPLQWVVSDSSSTTALPTVERAKKLAEPQKPVQLSNDGWVNASGGGDKAFRQVAPTATRSPLEGEDYSKRRLEDNISRARTGKGVILPPLSGNPRGASSQGPPATFTPCAFAARDSLALVQGPQSEDQHDVHHYTLPYSHI